MSNLLGSKIVRTIIWVLAGLIMVFIAFGFGVRVGEDRAGFASGFDRHYFRDFVGIGAGGGMMGSGTPIGGQMFGGMPVPVVMHGLAGTVVVVTPPTIMVEDEQNNEQSVVVATGTIIREYGGTISLGGIMTGDQVAVIGSPNADGQVVARFIRVFPAASSSPTSP